MAIGIIIAGTDRSAYVDTSSSSKGGQTSYTTAVSQRGSASVSLRVHAGDTTFAPLVGNPISLYDQNGTRVFGGLISEIVKTNEGNTQEICYACTCVSFERMLDKHRIQPQSYFNQTAGYIFTAIFNSLPGETVLLGTVQAGPTIAAAIYRHEVVTTVFDDLANQAGFVWGVDPQTEQLYFRSPTAVVLPFSVTGDPSTGAGVLYDTVQWDTAQQDFRSRQYITVNLTAISPDVDLLTGDGTTTSFSLRFIVDTVAQVVLLGVSASVQGTANGIQAGDTVTVSTVTYTFATTINNTIANQVLVGADDPHSMQHLREAINAGANAGVDYSTPTAVNPDCQAVTSGGNDITVIARVPGSAGNSIAVSDSAGGTRFSWAAATLAGGNDGPLRASVSGTFSGVPAAGNTITVDSTTYTFVTTLDNTVPSQVAIGATAANAASNLTAAITGSPNAGSGAQFSLPTIPHATCQASVSAGTVSVFAKTAGAAGNSIAVSASSAVFSWSAATLGGGVDGPTTAQASGTTGPQDWYWTPGIAGITAGFPLPSGVIAEVTYYRLGVDIIGVEDSALAAQRAGVEGGSGIYQALIDVSSSSDPTASDPTAAIALANATLSSYGLLTQTLTFDSDSTGFQPGCAVNVSLPPPFDTFLNGTWTIQQISGSYIPGMAGWRVQVQAIGMSLAGRGKSPDGRSGSVGAIARKASWQQFWMRLATVNPRRQRPGIGANTVVSGGGGGGDKQTPWKQNIDGANHTLYDPRAIFVGVLPADPNWATRSSLVQVTDFTSSQYWSAGLSSRSLAYSRTDASGNQDQTWHALFWPQGLQLKYLSSGGPPGAYDDWNYLDVGPAATGSGVAQVGFRYYWPGSYSTGGGATAYQCLLGGTHMLNSLEVHHPQWNPDGSSSQGAYNAASFYNWDHCTVNGPVSSTGFYIGATQVIDGSGNWTGSGGAGGAVSSVFGRTGAVVATAGDYTPAQVGAPPVARQIIAGTGLSGGGDLSADRTLSVVADTVNQQVQALHAAALIGTRHAINFMDTASATWTIADNGTGNRIDVSVVATGGAGGLADPTTTLGDLIVRGSSAVQRLGVGGDGQVLTADHTQTLGVKWAAASGGGAVSSVFTRTGAVVAQAGDYSASQVTNAVDSTQSYANPSWITSLGWGKIAGAPTMVNSISPGTLSGAVTLAGSGAVTVSQTGQTITIAATGGGTAVREIPAGTLNGTNVAFTLSFAPNPSASLVLELNGVAQEAGMDYTISGLTITYTVAPKAADWHMAWYTH